MDDTGLDVDRVLVVGWNVVRSLSPRLHPILRFSQSPRLDAIHIQVSSIHPVNRTE